MPKLILIIVASLGAGFAVAAWFVGAPGTRDSAADMAIVEFDEKAGIEERLAALESIVSAERQARQLLEDELFNLYAALDELEGLAEGEGPRETSAGDREARAEFAADVGNDRKSDEQRRLQALTEAGFSEARADWIMRRESELRMQAMQERFEALRSGEPPNLGNRYEGLRTSLRDEIGDAEYEMYLAAHNRPTSIGVRDLLEASPAVAAGLQPGDRITHYDGARVFSNYDLTEQTLRGEPGHNVVVNIQRDGVPMQVVLPRGPLGIMTGRRR